ncbi:MFS transporter [Zooshikella marina]|uniref:MFS transporter n=1 Tax=Zooshikella ganghwensis TaxID=202772 RepID=UPI0004234703|nr:MFS transporter [Zooshikella ganghwensis]MBU2706604.1 MFS transporter [Zooshikella ganghwensis]
MSSSVMNKTERKVTFSLAGVFAMRMLGLFMILPVLTVYGDQLIGATPALLGLAMGAYGVTQAILQIPFGFLSDRVGRKPIIFAGLILLMLGSIVAANSESVYGVIIGRALQGAGAVASAIMALVSDLTREEQRTKAMALIGMSIGLSFCIAMVAGPLVTQWWGLTGLFSFNGLLALIAMVLVWRVPTPVQQLQHRDTFPVISEIRQVLANTDLLRLDLGIFVLHFVLMALFVALPLALERLAGLPREQHWWVYLITLLSSFVAMLPFIILAEKKRKLKPVFLGALCLLIFSLVSMLWSSNHFTGLLLSIFLFFMAFNWLEASLPSMVSKLAPAGRKGTAIGIYSTCQFLGAALGGIAGGLVYQRYGFTGVISMAALVAVIWWVISWSMTTPPYLTTLMVNLKPVNDQSVADVSAALSAIHGVQEVVVIAEEQSAYLKVDRARLDMQALQAFELKA